ncbi:type II toxin-antitoxin system HicA family toxin [Chromobacterium subtsugae]|uniref:type II toxin-antitoxin system HicA family toxin n=1 Tax=Chromobacterium subtsugae TaxID=251747 RepID=UPI0020A148EA|nr:type II toxin-antitoxin system HicA family toxin [Chromobacterium subtsugae]
MGGSLGEGASHEAVSEAMANNPRVIDGRTHRGYSNPINNNAGKRMDSREFIRLLKADGWIEVACKGSHHQFKHPSKPGRVTVKHPTKDYKIGTWNSMLKQAGLK